MADIWSKAKDRLRWAVQLPLLTMDKALDELRWAHGNGACAVFMRGIEKVLNVHGGYVTPGLIDFHVHSYWGVNPYGFNADPICLASGVTTAVDAGSSGAVNFLGFKKLVHEQSRARMLAFVALAQHGVLNDPGELENLKFADPNGARKVSAMRAPSALGSRFGFIRRPSATTAGKRCE
jgi:dihydroorotase